MSEKRCPKGVHLVNSNGGCDPCRFGMRESVATEVLDAPTDERHESAFDEFTPTVESSDRGFLVSLPHAGAKAFFHFEAPEHRGRVIEAEVTVWLQGPGLKRDSFTARLDVLSLSKREAFSRQLNLVYNEGARAGPWQMLLNKACQLVREAMLGQDPTLHLQSAPREKRLPRLHDPLLDGGPNIFFAKGGSTKTTLALALGCAVAMGQDFNGSPTVQADVLFVDYEADVGTIQDRQDAILRGRGYEGSIPLYYFPARGVPLHDLAPVLQRKVDDGIGFIIVDSAALAAGADPEKAETAIRFFNALASLEVPSLTIAHETKAGEDQMPFGSVFWNNSARSLWNVKALQEPGHAGPVNVGLFHRKANNSRLHAPIGLSVTFDERLIRIEGASIQPEWAGEVSLSKRITERLISGARSVKQLATELEAKPDIVRARLNQMRETTQLGKSEDGSGLWGLQAIA